MKNSTITLPETGFVRISGIIGNSKANPPILPVVPISRSSWWAGVRCGKYPKPVKLGPRTTVWKVEDIRELISRNWEAENTDGVDKNHV